MSFSQACCTLPPVESNYVPKGKIEKVDDLEYYVIEEVNSKATLFCLYDIFGMHNNTLQFVDIISKVGFRVIVPDFFRGKQWTLDDYPPKNPEVFKGWVTNNLWDNRAHKDLLTIFKHLNLNAENDTIGAFGFCWGGKMIFEALKQDKPLFKAGVALHPALLTEEDFKLVNHPLAFIPSEDEKQAIPFFEYLKPKVKGNSELHDFTHTFHGFAAARGNFSNPENRELTTKAINITASFFNKIFA